MVAKYSSALVIVLLSILLPLHAMAAIVVSWDCNTEADMANYRVEYSRDGGSSWGVEANVDHVPGCKTQELGITRYITPGKKLYRLFAGDKSGNTSLPSKAVEYIKPVSPIGNPGGQEEAALPPSPFGGDAVTPPAPPPPVPPVVKPGDVVGFAVSSVTKDSAIATGTVPDGAKVNIRFATAPMGWGSATSATCDTLPCTLTGLMPDTAHEVQCIPYLGTMNQGAVYGAFSPVIAFKTLPAPVVPPPAPMPPPPSPPPPAPVGYNVKEALQAAVDKCKAAKSCSGKTFAQYLDAELKKVTP